MYSLGVVTPDPARDPTSAQILRVRHARAALTAVDAGSLRMHAGTGPLVALQGGAPASWDALLLRRLNPRGSDTVQFDFLDLLERQGALLINRPAALMLAESKFCTTGVLRSAGLPVPETVLTQDLADARETVARWGGAVVKRLYGELGEGVERLLPGDEAGWLSDWLEEEGALYLQRFVPSDGSDLRAFVVGDRVAAAMRRVPAPGQWKANIHLGGKGLPVQLLPETERLAVAATRALGLEYAGVDLIEGPQGPLVLELNGAPGWLGLQGATAFDVAGALVEHTVQRLDSLRVVR